MDPTFSVKSNGDRIRDRLAVFSNTTIYGRGIDVLVCTLDYRDDIVAVVDAMVLKPRGPEHEIIQPTISGLAGIEFLQAALDAAWKAGLRPTNYRDERPAEISAMDAHLQDMRRLVFGRDPSTADLMEKGARSHVG